MYNIEYTFHKVKVLHIEIYIQRFLIRKLNIHHPTNKRATVSINTI